MGSASAGCVALQIFLMAIGLFSFHALWMIAHSFKINKIKPHCNLKVDAYYGSVFTYKRGFGNLNRTLKNKGALKVLHSISTFFGSSKNHLIKGSLNNHFLNTYLELFVKQKPFRQVLLWHCEAPLFLIVYLVLNCLVISSTLQLVLNDLLRHNYFSLPYKPLL